MASVLQGAGTFGFNGNGPVNSETKAVLCFFFFFLQREVLAWGRLLANHRSSEVQVLLPR